jgi:hypothetical protein
MTDDLLTGDTGNDAADSGAGAGEGETQTDQSAGSSQGGGDAGDQGSTGDKGDTGAGSDDKGAGKEPPIPTTADGYKVDVHPDVLRQDPEYARKVQQFALERKMTQAEAQRVADAAHEQLQTAAKQLKETAEALKSEWGEDKYPTNLREANKAASQLGQDFVDALKATGAQNHKDVILAMYKLSTMLGEDTLEPGSTGPGKGKPERELGIDGNPLIQYPSMEGDN